MEAGDGKVMLEPHAAAAPLGAHSAPAHPGLEAGLLSAALRGAPARGGLEGLGLADSSLHAAGALQGGGGGMLGYPDPHAGVMPMANMAGGIGLQEFEQEHLFAVPTDGEWVASSAPRAPRGGRAVRAPGGGGPREGGGSGG